jgi:hypothetical protein
MEVQTGRQYSPHKCMEPEPAAMARSTSSSGRRETHFKVKLAPVDEPLEAGGTTGYPYSERLNKVTINRLTIAKLALTSLAVVGLSSLSPSTAFAGDQDFTVVNRTGVEIHKIYVSPHSSDEWGEDILGKDTLDDGESVAIEFGNHVRAAHWDLKVVDGHGNSITWENLNLLEISKVILYFKDGKATADVE